MRRSLRLLASVATGVLAVIIAASYGSSVRDEANRERQEMLAAYGGDLVSVCVATRDIDSGEVLDEANVQLEEWVGTLLPKGAYTALDEVVGREATSRIPARTVVCPAFLEEVDGAIEVPSGMVAVSVPANEQSAVGGAIAPGDRVDVYVSDSGVADRLCSARVIDTSTRADEVGSTAIAWVTLAVEPESVSEVLAATARGTISLTLPDRASAGTTTEQSEEDQSQEGQGEEGQGEATSEGDGDEDGMDRPADS